MDSSGGSVPAFHENSRQRQSSVSAVCAISVESCAHRAAFQTAVCPLGVVCVCVCVCVCLREREIERERERIYICSVLDELNVLESVHISYFTNLISRHAMLTTI
jgi:hypothetical protein